MFAAKARKHDQIVKQSRSIILVYLTLLSIIIVYLTLLTSRSFGNLASWPEPQTRLHTTGGPQVQLIIKFQLTGGKRSGSLRYSA